MPKNAMRLVTLICSVSITSGLLIATGCNSKPKQPTKAAVQKYEVLPPRKVPDWLRDSVLEQTDLLGTDPQVVNNFGLVVNLQGTGDAKKIPTNVREYMIGELTKRGFGSANQQGFENVTPERVLNDNRAAVVRVDALIPPGARKGQRIDVQVTALENNDTTSLAGGMLYLTDLAPNGANPMNPGGLVDVLVKARGAVFVNPAYALDPNLSDTSQRRSLRQGIVISGGEVVADRPLVLRVRSAELRTSRAIEKRLDLQFHDESVASAKDEGVVQVTVPKSYSDDWNHFAQVMLHTFYFADEKFCYDKAKLIAAEAVKPDAPLFDISYTWEALGKVALPIIQPLYTNENPDIAFAAARAGVFIGDRSAEQTLIQFANDSRHPFQLESVATLGKLGNVAEVRIALRDLLDSPQTSVRIEAYQALIKMKDQRIASRPIGDKYFIDLIESNAPTLIYATRLGTPRIAVMGRRAEFNRSALFSAMDTQFTISASPQQRGQLTVFYRGPGVSQPVQITTSPDIAVLLARLGGDGPAGAPTLNFNYGQIVAMLNTMSSQGMLVSATTREKIAFVLQDPPSVQQNLRDAPALPDAPRPITDSEQASGN